MHIYIYTCNFQNERVMEGRKEGRKKTWGKRTVICAYLPHTTLPPAVTIPSSLIKVRWWLSAITGIGDREGDGI